MFQTTRTAIFAARISRHVGLNFTSQPCDRSMWRDHLEDFGVHDGERPACLIRFVEPPRFFALRITQRYDSVRFRLHWYSWAISHADTKVSEVCPIEFAKQYGPELLAIYKQLA